MNDRIILDPKTTALLVMDFQDWIIDGFAADGAGLVSRLARLIAAARVAQLSVI